MMEAPEEMAALQAVHMVEVEALREHGQVALAKEAAVGVAVEATQAMGIKDWAWLGEGRLVAVGREAVEMVVGVKVAVGTAREVLEGASVAGWVRVALRVRAAGGPGGPMGASGIKAGGEVMAAGALEKVAVGLVETAAAREVGAGRAVVAAAEAVMVGVVQVMAAKEAVGAAVAGRVGRQGVGVDALGDHRDAVGKEEERGAALEEV